MTGKCLTCKHWSSPHVVAGSRRAVGDCGVDGGPVVDGQCGIAPRAYSFWKCDLWVIGDDDVVRLREVSIEEQEMALTEQYGPRTPERSVT